MVIITKTNPETGEILTFSQDGYLNTTLLGFRRAIEKHNTSAVIIIDGRSGMGKTTLGNQVGITLDDNFCLEKLYYTPQDFIEALKTAKPGDCLMFDEAMLISSRSALSSINKMIVQAMSMIRSKKLFIIFCVNSFFDLDKNLAISRADLLLHVFGQSLVERGKFGAFFKGSDGQDRIKLLYLLGKKYYSYSAPKSNFHGRFPKEFVVNEKKYEVQKQKGVNEFLTTTGGARTQKQFEDRNTLIRVLYGEGWTPKKIAEKTNINIRMIQKVLRIEKVIDEYK